MVKYKLGIWRGVGDAMLNSRELSVAFYTEDYVIPGLIGMAPQRFEDISQYLSKGAYWGPNILTIRLTCGGRVFKAAGCGTATAYGCCFGKATPMLIR